jgi:hypothetical protein
MTIIGQTIRTGHERRITLAAREENDALDHDLAEARQAKTVDVKRIRELEADIERLEDRYAASRRAEIERRFAG